jgi:TM2 domain-containing membrane protein YozV
MEGVPTIVVFIFDVIYIKQTLFYKEVVMAGQGSTGNVLAAICSVIIPGLGQLVQGRLLAAIIQFGLAALLWLVLLGWIVHIYSIVDAARFKSC